jgi:hypothetical protein
MSLEEDVDAPEVPVCFRGIDVCFEAIEVSRSRRRRCRPPFW